jgi:hypothetical protein
MARASTIARLHQEPAATQAKPGQQVGTVKALIPEPSMLDRQRAEWQRPLRRHFGRGGSAVAPPDLMGTMVPDTSPDHAGRFAALAQRDQMAHLVRHLARGRSKNMENSPSFAEQFFAPPPAYLHSPGEKEPRASQWVALVAWGGHTTAPF